MKTDCNVARDLMPLCIDDAASEESVKYLNDHLSQCEECKALFEDMKAAMPKREAGETAQDQAQFGQLAHMMKQMHRWRVWRNVIIGVLAGILAVVGVYAGWQGLMVQYHAEYPTKEYKVSLAQLSDGRVVVGVNYLQSKRNIGLVIGGSSKSLRIWFETTIIPQNMATENKNGPVYIISNIEKIDTIAIGHSGEQIVWRRGDAIAKASEEMEAYYRADTEMSQYWAEVTQELKGEIDWDGGEESRTRRESLQTKLESLRVQVPEWQ